MPKSLAQRIAGGLGAAGTTRATVSARPAGGSLWPSTIRLEDLMKEPDPARRGLAFEFLTEGRILADLPLEGGGALQVTAHDSCEAMAPPGTPPGTRQEWRVLRFIPAEGENDLVQSVTKVCIGPPGHEPREWLRPDALPLDYTKSFLAVALSALEALGRPVLPESAAAAGEPLRVLCIGLGGGSMPSFLSQRLVNCVVDVVELEAAVVDAARAGMGFVADPRITVSVGDGVDFALRAAQNAGNDLSAPYDAVLVDAYNADGDVPMALQSSDGGLVHALSLGLLRRSGGIVATNFLPSVDVAIPLSAYRSALVDRGAGLSFSVQAEGTGNRIAVQTCGGPPALRRIDDLEVRMHAAATEIQATTSCPFDMARLATRNIYAWSAIE